MTTIRPLLPPDLPLIRSWMRDTPEAPAWSDSDLARLATAGGSGERLLRRAWIAEEGATPEGFIVSTALCLPGSAAECEIEFVMTAPGLRRKGVARVLVGRVLAWAGKLTAEEVRLEVRASNHAAQRLYEGCGFVVAGRRPGYYADPIEDAVLMRRRIDPAGQRRLV